MEIIITVKIYNNNWNWLDKKEVYGNNIVLLICKYIELSYMNGKLNFEIARITYHLFYIDSKNYVYICKWGKKWLKFNPKGNITTTKIFVCIFSNKFAFYVYVHVFVYICVFVCLFLFLDLERCIYTYMYKSLFPASSWASAISLLILQNMIFSVRWVKSDAVMNRHVFNSIKYF